MTNELHIVRTAATRLLIEITVEPPNRNAKYPPTTENNDPYAWAPKTKPLVWELQSNSGGWKKEHFHSLMRFVLWNHWEHWMEILRKWWLYSLMWLCDCWSYPVWPCLNWLSTRICSFRQKKPIRRPENVWKTRIRLLAWLLLILNTRGNA